MPKKIRAIDILENGKKYIPAIGRDDHEKIMQIEGIPLEIYHQFIDQNYQENKLKTLKAALPLDKLNESFEGRITDYAPISHHVWFTNMEKPRNMLTYVSDVFKYNQYNPNKVPGAIDHKDNAFIGSIINLEKGAKESNLPVKGDNFYHILWTNFSRKDLVDHPELKDLRKICGIDSTERELPKFIVLNIEDVMDSEDVTKVTNQANPEQILPTVISDGLVQMKEDLLSIKDTLKSMYKAKKFAGMSDTVRLAAVKDLGGIYFDLDYNLYDQAIAHSKGKYNLFDLMKHYDSIVGREDPKRLCNAIISTPKAGSKVVTSLWETVKKNIEHPESVDYVKYAKNNFDKVICQTGPIAATVGFLKAAGQYDIALDFGLMYYNEFKRPPHTPKINGSVAPIGYDTWGGSWLECKYSQYKNYKYFELDTGRGITAAEWEAMFD